MNNNLAVRPRRLFANSVSDFTTEDVTVDFGAFIERLLIADEYILHSRNLQEIPYLVERFGAGPVARLFAQDGLRVCVEKASVGLIDDNSTPKDPYILHAGAVRLEQPDSSQRDLEHLNGWLGHIRTADRERVLNRVGEALVFAGQDFETSLGADFGLAVQNSSRIYPYLEIVLKRMGVWKAGRAFAFSAEVGDTITDGRIQGTRLMIETDLEKSYGLESKFVGDVIREAVLGLSGEVSRVNEMREYDAVAEFNEEDMPLFGAHIDFLRSQVLPDQATDNFYQTIEFSGAPDFRDPQFLDKVDLDMLIEARQSDELQAFREWLWRAGEFEESDIVQGMDELSNSLRKRFGGMLTTRTGKTIRVLAASAMSQAIGALISGPLGVATGLVPGLANAHLLNRFVMSSGTRSPLAFVRDVYPSLFTPHPDKYDTLRERRKKSLKRRRK